MLEVAGRLRQAAVCVYKGTVVGNDYVNTLVWVGAKLGTPSIAHGTWC